MRGDRACRRDLEDRVIGPCLTSNSELLQLTAVTVRGGCSSERKHSVTMSVVSALSPDPSRQMVDLPLFT